MENQAENTLATETAPVEKKQVSKKQILAWLDEGKSRNEIRELIGATKAQFTRMMKDPQLKGRKTKTSRLKDPFVLENDAPDAPVFKPRQKKDKAEVAGTNLASGSNKEEAEA